MRTNKAIDAAIGIAIWAAIAFWFWALMHIRDEVDAYAPMWMVMLAMLGWCVVAVGATKLWEAIFDKPSQGRYAGQPDSWAPTVFWITLTWSAFALFAW